MRAMRIYFGSRRDSMVLSRGRFVSVCFSFVLLAGCSYSYRQPVGSIVPSPTPVTSRTLAERFSFPVGNGAILTQAKDNKDDWYNALEFGENAHLGEDWNKNTGGNTDCGEPVYAAANGVVTYAADAGVGWGNVIIVEHTLPSGDKVQTLYGHLIEIQKSVGEVKIREQIGKVGNANGRYPCHLHFEIRTANCPDWNKAGGGYANDKTGWTDPSDFIYGRR
ncbi:MAG: M23 family metallopeptidase [Acidobacteria bacterium]|nr:M23 family metallopeptidase [Acidobacteriota bacterium]